MPRKENRRSAVQRDPERATRRAVTALNRLGYTVTLNPREDAA
ncbi:hypothetical protein [Streptomyces sp. WMMC940]|nr:hypothetical protein [Streptomyces sp. WMMC940]MCZ7458433.1 hypothetical protein [Streptomyces sp. WMMC940]